MILFYKYHKILKLIQLFSPNLQLYLLLLHLLRCVDHHMEGGYVDGDAWLVDCY